VEIIELDKDVYLQIHLFCNILIKLKQPGPVIFCLSYMILHVAHMKLIPAQCEDKSDTI
jgi:hypothetical protein